MAGIVLLHLAPSCVFVFFDVEGRNGMEELRILLLDQGLIYFLFVFQGLGLCRKGMDRDWVILLPLANRKRGVNE